MKIRLITKCGAVCATLSILALTLSTTSVSGAGNTQRFRVPQDMSMPLYVTGLGHTGLGPTDWVVAAFYYPTGIIPIDYDLFNEPVPYPIGAVPLVEGFFVFHDGIPFPTPQLMHNAPGAKVPIWFVPVQNFANGVPGTYDPFTFKIGSMIAEKAIVGWADSFTQTWEVGTMADNNTVVASGIMENGQRFWVKSTIAIASWNGHSMAPNCIVHFGP